MGFSPCCSCPAVPTALVTEKNPTAILRIGPAPGSALSPVPYSSFSLASSENRNYNANMDVKGIAVGTDKMTGTVDGGRFCLFERVDEINSTAGCTVADKDHDWSW
jgi:hypothetical protein